MSLEAWGDEPWGAEYDPDIERLLGEGYRSADDMTKAAHDVLDERLRQIGKLGYGHERDDQFARGELIMAAVSYGTNAFVRLGMVADGYPADRIDELSCNAGTPRTWPWSLSRWRPHGGTRRILVKAAALLLAEIERLDRAEAKAKQVTP